MGRILSSVFLLLISSAFIFAQAPAQDDAALTGLLNEFLAGAGRNDPSVHERHFAIDDTTRQHIWGIAQRSSQREDSVRVRVRPPVSLDGLPCDQFDEIGQGTVSAFQHHAVMFHRSQHLASRE